MGFRKDISKALVKGLSEKSCRIYVDRLEPGLDFYLVADDAVTIHLITMKVY
jgi:hypothetical protein